MQNSVEIPARVMKFYRYATSRLFLVLSVLTYDPIDNLLNRVAYTKASSKNGKREVKTAIKKLQAKPLRWPAGPAFWAGQRISEICVVVLVFDGVIHDSLSFRQLHLSLLGPAQKHHAASSPSPSSAIVASWWYCLRLLRETALPWTWVSR